MAIAVKSRGLFDRVVGHGVGSKIMGAPALAATSTAGSSWVQPSARPAGFPKDKGVLDAPVPKHLVGSWQTVALCRFPVSRDSKASQRRRPESDNL